MSDDVDPVDALRQKIEIQKRIVRSLQTDFSNPMLLDQSIIKQIEAVKKLPSEIDDEWQRAQVAAANLPKEIDREIQAAEERLARLRATAQQRITEANNYQFSVSSGRAAKMEEAKKRLEDLQYRRVNTKELLIAADEELQAMNRRLKRLENSTAIDKARTLQKQLKALEAQLPVALRGKSFDEINAIINNGCVEGETE